MSIIIFIPYYTAGSSPGHSIKKKNKENNYLLI